MQEFEEASIGGQPQGIPTAPPDQTFQVTTDDLVYMIGEKAIGERQSNKLIAMLQNNVAYLQQELMKLQSTGVAEHNELEALRQRLEAAEARAANAEQAQAGQGASFQARIVDLENHVYQTALERDAAIKERDRLAQSNAQLQERLDRSLPQIETLRITLDNLKGKADQLVSVTQERDALRAELEALKAAQSGQQVQDGGEWDASAPATAKPAKKGKK